MAHAPVDTRPGATVEVRPTGKNGLYMGINFYLYDHDLTIKELINEYAQDDTELQSLTIRGDEGEALVYKLEQKISEFPNSATFYILLKDKKKKREGGRRSTRRHRRGRRSTRRRAY